MKKALFFTLALVSIAITSHAQEPPSFDNNPPEGGPQSIPVDGGASLLAAAGLGYVARKFKKYNQKA